MWQRWRNRIWFVLWMVGAIPTSMSATRCHSLPPAPTSEQCTISTPLEAVVVMEQTEINAPVSPTTVIKRSRRTISQLTNPTPVTYSQYVHCSFAKYLQTQLNREKGIILNLPAEQISYPFHSFW